jgi:hypothetical protein
MLLVADMYLLFSCVTVKASNFAPHGNFGFFLASSIASVDESCPKKMNRTEFVDLKVLYNFYSLHLSVGRVSMIARPSEKKRSKVSMRFKASMRSKVRGFDVSSLR